MTVALIVVGSVLAALLIVAFIVWAHQYTKAGPNEVLIISGAKQRRGPDGEAVGYRIIRGGGTFVRPFREKVERLSLELMQFDVRTGETYSTHGVPAHGPTSGAGTGSGWSGGDGPTLCHRAARSLRRPVVRSLTVWESPISPGDASC